MTHLLNSPNSQLFGLFPIPVAVFECTQDISQAINFLENCEMAPSPEADAGDTYGSLSKDTYILDNPELAPLRKFIKHSIHDFAYNVLAHEFERYSITQSWVSHKKPGEQHTPHVHFNNVISGAFYWQDDYSEAITFYKPDTMIAVSNMLSPRILPEQSSQSEFTWHTFNVGIKPRSLVLFPAYLKHGVNKNTSNTTRKCLAFNSVPMGGVSTDCSLSRLDFKRLSNDI